MTPTLAQLLETLRKAYASAEAAFSYLTQTHHVDPGLARSLAEPFSTGVDHSPRMTVNLAALEQFCPGAHVVLEMVRPRLLLIENFVSPEFCDTFAAAARDNFRNEGSGPYTRLYAGSHIKKAIRQMRFRAAKILDRDPNETEDTAVSGYSPGQKYSLHADYLKEDDPAQKAMLEASGHNQRVATFLVYLDEPAAGGRTYMANVGLAVAPRRGSALLFCYPELNLKSATLHAGTDVLAGTKLITPITFRERALYCREDAAYINPTATEDDL